VSSVRAMLKHQGEALLEFLMIHGRANDKSAIEDTVEHLFAETNRGASLERFRQGVESAFQDVITPTRSRAKLFLLMFAN
jgi:hypothetical protein